VATIGKSSERALQRFGVENVIAPRGRFDSEALLALPQLAPERMHGRRVVVFRGDGGRELLGETLAARGAIIEYVTCYRRSRPDVDPAPLLDLWARDALDAVTVTSSEGLRNLFDMVGPAGRARLRTTPVFVPHERIAEEARRLGLRQVILTAPGDEGLAAGLVDHFSMAHTLR
jgi:uroporphyrinogen-III synthase